MRKNISSINYKGFTLMEMLIVLVIMSLLLTLVPPLLSGALPSVTIKATANDLIQDLKHLRNMAVLQSRKTQIEIDSESGAYFSDDLKRKGTRISEDIKLIASHIGLRTVEDKKPVIAFFSDGSSSGGVVTLKDENSAYSVIVDWITGSVTLQEGLYGDQY